jgi:prepilin-type N-terminal cleavage/methylation domain-containing protein
MAMWVMRFNYGTNRWPGLIGASGPACRPARREPARGAATLARPQAFTLIELLIVVALLAILAAVVLPGLDASTISQLRAAADLIASDLAYAQGLAISTGEPIQVQFQVQQNRYQLVDPDGGAYGEPVTIEYPTGDYPLHDNLYIVDFDDPGSLRGVRLESVAFNGSSTLEFGPYGEPSEGGTIVLRAGDRRLTLTVEPVLGQVRIGQIGR